MSQQQPTRKAFISGRELAEILNLSESRFRALVKSGVFPRPIRHGSCKRPVFDLELIEKALEIRQTGIGLHGQPVIFNRMKASRKPRQQRQPQPVANDRPIQDDHADLIEALKSLGMTATNDTVAQAMAEIYPNSTEGIEPGEVIRKVFLNLRAKKK